MPFAPSSKPRPAKLRSPKAGQGTATPRKPKPVTAAYLRNSALYTLAQRAMSTKTLADLLTRRAKRRLAVRSLEPDIALLIERSVADLAALGMVDDRTFAELRANTLVRRGFSKRRVAMGLKVKGLDAETIDGAGVADIDDHAQARLYAKKKRLGAFSRSGAAEATRAKDLRAMARAGFSYAVAAKALDARPDDLED